MATSNKEMERFKEFEEELLDARNSLTRWANEADEAERFLSNIHYTDEQRNELEYEERPALTFNQYGQVVRVITGTEITNRFEPHFLPRTIEDQGGVDVFNEMLRYYRNHCDAGHEESVAFKDAVNQGLGVTETFVSYDEDPNGKICTVRVKPEEVSWDPSAVRPNLLDAKHIHRGKWLDLEEFEDLFPDKVDKFFTTMGNADMQTMYGMNDPATVVNVRRSWLYKSGFKAYESQKNRVLVIERQYWKREKGFIHVDPMTGVLSFVDEQQAQEILAQAQATGQPAVLQGYQKRYYREFWGGPVLLAEEPIATNMYSYNFITGYFDETREMSVPYGLYRVIRDPQMWANKFLSQVVHIIGSNPKGSVHAEKGAFVNPSQAKTDWAKPNAVIMYNDGALTQKRVMIVEPPRMPQAAFEMANFALQAVPQLTGVNPFMTGQVGDLKRTASSSVQAMIRQGTVGLAQLFDALKLYRKQTGRLYMQMIRTHIQPGVSVRVVGPLQERFVQFTKDHQFMNFDVAVDEAPVSTTNMMEVWETLTEQGLLQKIMEMGLPIPPSIISIIPGLPQSLKDEWTQMIQQMMGQQPPAQGQPPVQ